MGGPEGLRVDRMMPGQGEGVDLLYLPNEFVGGRAREDNHLVSRRPAFLGHEVYDRLFTMVAENGLVRLVDERGDRVAQPVVATGVAIPFVHPLLDDGPFPRLCEEKGVVVELVSVLDGGGIDLGDQAAGFDEPCAVADSCLVADLSNLLRCLPGGSALSARDK